jgi:hypothetical protein
MNKKVVGVIPQPEFIPFFDLQYDGRSNYRLVVRPRGALDSDVQHLAYLVEPICPQINEITTSQGGIPKSLQNQLAKQYKAKSLRQLAREYGVSYETVRRILKVIKQH